MNKVEEICKEYGFDLEKPETYRRDETPVEVSFYGITQEMPRWKAEEFGSKLADEGFCAIINGVFWNIKSNGSTFF